ncbi:MAG: hypothetical protein ACPLRU_06665, partial [Desulfofundulus sp.]
MAGNGILKPAQQRLIQALLVSRDVRTAAQMAGVPERTAWRWLGLPAFQAELNRAQGESLALAGARL